MEGERVHRYKPGHRHLLYDVVLDGDRRFDAGGIADLAEEGVGTFPLPDACEAPDLMADL